MPNGRPRVGSGDSRCEAGGVVATAAIVAVGSELLAEDRLDTNSLLITTELRRYGVDLISKTVVGDSVEAISRSLWQAAEIAQLVVVSGGLGPTRDDCTREAAALATGRVLELDIVVLDQIRALYQSRGRRMPETNRRQAQVLQGSEVLPNSRGTAPGARFSLAKATVFLFPGVPSELIGMISSSLTPWLSSRNAERRVGETELAVACLPESRVEELLAPVYQAFGRDGVTVLARPGEVRVRLRSPSDPERKAMVDLATHSLGDALFTIEEAHLGGAETLEVAVSAVLRERGLTLSVAESCTGGLLGQRLSSFSGSSATFVGGAITYSNQLKTSILGVDASLIEREGAVSEAVAASMACAARRCFSSDWALSVTGIAGPRGGTEEKPVGTVWFGLATPTGDVLTSSMRFPGDRERIRLQASQYALDLLRRSLLGLPTLDPEFAPALATEPKSAIGPIGDAS